MKVKIVTLMVCLLSATHLCAQTVEQKLSHLHWLEGTWHRTNAKAGHGTVEQWQKVDNTLWKGTAVNLKGTDTTFVEKTTILVKGSDIFYVADVPENKGEVYFKFTVLTPQGFVCENPQHDFPKKITYDYDGRQLRAVISGNGKSIEYLFEKKD